MRFYLVYRVGLVDKIFGLVDLVNKALGLVNKPKWHFEMACILLMMRDMRTLLQIRQFAQHSELLGFSLGFRVRDCWV